MAIEAWEVLQRQNGNVEDADRIAAFRHSHGDVELPPTVEDQKLMYKTVYDRLPYFDDDGITMLADLYNTGTYQRLAKKGKGKTFSREKVTLGHALIAAYYGTKAPRAEILDTFVPGKDMGYFVGFLSRYVHGLRTFLPREFQMGVMYGISVRRMGIGRI